MEKRPKAHISRDYRRSVLIWLHLVRVHNRIAHEQYSLLAAHGLTYAQFDVLAHLAAEPGLSQQALAERLLVTKGNICGLIDRLESAELVERQGDPADRRAHRLYITAAGLHAYQATAPQVEADLARRMTVLSPDEQATLLALLGKLDRASR